MASFLTGPAAKIVGSSMQAMGIGIPVSETSTKLIDSLRDFGVPVPPKNWFKKKEKGGISPRISPKKTCYDTLEDHIYGMLRVVKPAMELKNLIKDNCSKSAERPTRRTQNESPDEKLKFYTPQKCKSTTCALFQDKSVSPKKKIIKKSYENCDHNSRRQLQSSSEEEDDNKCCMCSARTKYLIKLPCGLLICSKCDKNGDHDLECKKCKKLMR